MARSRNRKKAPKKAPMLSVVEDGEKKRIRADGTEVVPKRTRVRGAGQDPAKVTDSTPLPGTPAGKPARSRRPLFELGGESGERALPSAEEARGEFDKEDARRIGQASFRSSQLKDFTADRTAGQDVKYAEQIAALPGGAAPVKRKSMRVNKAAMRGINTATVPEAGTPSGQRPAAAYLGDGGNGGTMRIGRGSGAPLADGKRVAGNQRQLRSKENIRISRSRAANKIPKMGAGNYDPNNSLYAGDRPHEQLVREQKRGVGGKKFTRMLTESNSSGVSYHETTDPSRISNVTKLIAGQTGASVEGQARHIAKSSKAGYLQPGSIGEQPALPIKNTDEAKMARTAFFGQQARQHDVNKKVTAMTKSNRSSAKNLGLKANPNASDEEAIRLGATSGSHEGLYGAGKDVKKAIAVRDRYVRKYGHKLSDEGINNLPGIDREQAMEITANGAAEKKSKPLNYYLGENSAGDTKFNKGIEKTKLQEIAYHTKQKVSHVSSWVKETGVDVHQLHKDLSSQVYDSGVAKKAWVPTSDPVQTHRMVEYHPSGRVKSRRGRTKEGANLPRHWTEIQKSPGSDAGTLTHTQYISHKIAEHMETKPFRNKSNDRGSKQTIATAMTAGTGGALPQRQAIQTPFGSSDEVIRRNEGPGNTEITQEGKQLGRGRAY
jgi:hypothetical protein